MSDHSPVSPDRNALIRILRERLPGLLAVHAFGSRVHGTARPDSDLDLAVLVEGYLDVVQGFDLAGQLADVAGCPVDLVDLRAASTVMQHQIITRGERWWSAGLPAELFELYVLDEKMDLDAARAGLLQDIAERGSVYGR